MHAQRRNVALTATGPFIATVQSAPLQAPPNPSKECADFHAAIRQHFSKREIGMLFGAAAAYQEYRTTYDRTRAKYAAFVRDAEENGPAVAVAAK